MTYHLWCPSNSWVEDFVRLRIFHQTLMGAVVKWYIKLPRGAYQDFNSLAMEFLTHLQLPVHYEIGTHLLTSLK